MSRQNGLHRYIPFFFVHLFVVSLIWVSPQAALAAKKSLKPKTYMSESSYDAGQKMTVSVKMLDRKGKPVAKKKIKKTRVIIRDADGKKIKSAKLKYVKKGLYRYSFSIPEDSEPGTWKVQTLAWDRKGKKARNNLKVMVNALEEDEVEEENEHAEPGSESSEADQYHTMITE